MKIQQIHHKKNELFEVEFFTDKECTKLIKDYLPYAENAKISEMSNFYIEIEKGDITPLTALLRLSHNVNDYFYNPYIPKYQLFNLLNCTGKIKTLDDITPNLSKYIPEDNAVLFLSEEDCNKYYFTGLLNLVLNDNRFDVKMESGATIEDVELKKKMKLTIFLPHGTQSELQKAEEEVAKELKEKYGLEEVNVCVLHWFIEYGVLHYEILNIDESDYFRKTPEEAFEYIQNTLDCDDDDFIEKCIKEYDDDFQQDFEKKAQSFFKSLSINKIITTNSTGILKPEDSTERLQVIDAKEIFEEYLKENN